MQCKYVTGSSSCVKIISVNDDKFIHTNKYSFQARLLPKNVEPKKCAYNLTYNNRSTEQHCIASFHLYKIAAMSK